MSEKPIIFSTPMVKAILEGRKTQTRRVIKPQPTFIESSARWEWRIPKSKIIQCETVLTASREWWEYLSPEQMPYKPGDILWVRETWAASNGDELPKGYYYRANCKDSTIVSRWKPSIFMPREAARLFLEVKSVRVERLRDISEKDAEAEGVRKGYDEFISSAPLGKVVTHKYSYKKGFKDLWDSLNAKRGFSWEINPWVWVIEFERKE
jgi:hypothetical protein